MVWLRGHLGLQKFLVQLWYLNVQNALFASEGEKHSIPQDCQMEFSSIKRLSRWESSQSKLLFLTHPYLWTGWEGREGNPKTNVKAACQFVLWPSPPPGEGSLQVRQDLGKAVGDELSMASLFGSRPEWGRGLHNSLAGVRSQAEAREFPAAYNHLWFLCLFSSF